MAKKKALVRFGSLAFPLLVVALVFGSLAKEPAPAAAEGAPPPPDITDPAEDPEEWLQKFFQPYPADEGALTWDDLTPEEKEAASRADEWAQTQHGHEVHQRWRKASREGARLSRLKRAEYTSGLAGLEGLGVE